MRTYWTTLGAIAAVVTAGMLLTACPGQPPSEPPSGPAEAVTPASPGEAETPETPDEGAAASTPAVPRAFVDIDIGDITYGVYANIELLQRDVGPGMDVHRLSSPRFDHRTQLLTVNLSPPYPDELPLTILFGSTRSLMGHAVIMKVHTFREYTDADGEKVVEEILTFDRVLGYNRLVGTPELIDLNPFVDMTELPSTMLVYCELEAWLFLNTNPETLDPDTANLDAADYKRYPGFNPARINLLGGGSEE